MSSDCILWTGRLNNSGYGPHKRLWAAKNGPVPKGRELHHDCEMKPCINRECPGCGGMHPKRSQLPDTCPCCTHPRSQHAEHGCVLCLCWWGGPAFESDRQPGMSMGMGL